MTEADWKALERYVRDCADRYGLMDWEITVSRDPADDGTYAQIKPVVGRKVTHVRFADDFRQETTKVQREVVVHELTHLHLASATHSISEDLRESGAVTAVMAEAIWKGFQRQLEYGVDGIAMAIACDFPLITWPKRTRTT